MTNFNYKYSKSLFVDDNLRMLIFVAGLIKFFGNVARVHPKEVCDKFPIFIRTVMDLLDDPNITLRGISIETVGFIGGTVEGKLAFDKIGNKTHQVHSLNSFKYNFSRYQYQYILMISNQIS